MEAIEFVTKVENGNIKVPNKYLPELTDEFRVIILIEQKEKKISKKKKSFKAFAIDTKGLKFDRDEANER